MEKSEHIWTGSSWLSFFWLVITFHFIPISPYRPIAFLLISKAVWLSFSIDFLSATSCSDFNSLSLYLFISSSSRVSNSVRSCPPRAVPWTSFLILHFIFSHYGGETFSNCTKSYRKSWISIEVSCNLLPNLIPLSTFWFVLGNSQWGHLSHQKQIFFLIPLHSYPKNNKSYLKLKVRGGQSFDLVPFNLWTPGTINL